MKHLGQRRQAQTVPSSLSFTYCFLGSPVSSGRTKQAACLKASHRFSSVSCTELSPPTFRVCRMSVRAQLEKVHNSQLRKTMFEEEVENREILERAGQHFVIDRLVS